MPLISVVLPTFNVSPFIAAMLADVLGQTVSDIEVLVVDDCSTDGTPDVVRRLATRDPRLRLLALERNLGAGAARNLAIAQARGEWLAFVDADDAMTRDRLERLHAAACALDVHWVADDQFISMDGEAVPFARLLVDEGDQAHVTSLAHIVARDRPGSFGYGTLKPLVRRSFVVEHGIGFGAVRRSNDFLFHIACGAAGARMGILPVAMYHYRVGHGSIISRAGRIGTCRAMLVANRRALAIVGDADSAARAALLERGGMIQAWLGQEVLRNTLISRRFRLGLRYGMGRPGILASFMARMAGAASRRLFRLPGNRATVVASQTQRLGPQGVPPLQQVGLPAE